MSIRVSVSELKGIGSELKGIGESGESDTGVRQTLFSHNFLIT